LSYARNVQQDGGPRVTARRRRSLPGTRPRGPGGTSCASPT